MKLKPNPIERFRQAFHLFGIIVALVGVLVGVVFSFVTLGVMLGHWIFATVVCIPFLLSIAGLIAMFPGDDGFLATVNGWR